VKLSSDGGKMQVIFGESELSVGEQPTDDAAARRKKQRRSEHPGENTDGGMP
jgi:hypothetical protein